MANALKKELDDLVRQQNALTTKISLLQRKMLEQRKAPPADQAAWTIDVRFDQDGKLYNFLILRVNGMFYTTGTGNTAFFRTWTDLLDWLDSVAGHSAMIPLRASYTMTDRSPLEGRAS